MKNFASFRVLIALSLLLGGQQLFAKSHMKSKSVSSEELQWIPNPGRPDEVSMAVVWGDFKKGKHGAFHKFKAGTKIENHTHSANLYGVVVQGTLETGPEGSPKKLGPGSYFMDSANDPHVTNCISTEDCILYVHTSGKFDMKPVKKAAK